MGSVWKSDGVPNWHPVVISHWTFLWLGVLSFPEIHSTQQTDAAQQQG